MIKRDEKGRFVKGYHPRTEFKKGHTPWSKGLDKTELKKYYVNGWKNDKRVSWRKGQHPSPDTEFKEGHLGLKGEQSPSWKGGITPINKIIRASKEYKSWRTAVFERDNYTCIQCKIRNGNGKTIIFHAHHIKPFAKHPKLRFNINNGQTLCFPCHRKTETYKKWI